MWLHAPTRINVALAMTWKHFRLRYWSQQKLLVWLDWHCPSFNVAIFSSLILWRVGIFQLQKPADLEGECPFLGSEEPCPFGLACRFSGTHGECLLGVNTLGSHQKSSEMNALNKDVQKLLWKNKMPFPKSDAQLKTLGLMVLMLFVLIFFFLSFYLSPTWPCTLLQ